MSTAAAEAPPAVPTPGPADPTPTTPPAPAAALRPPRLLWMDPCRGLAIAMVVAYHAIGHLRAIGGVPSPGPGSGELHGDAGVDAFLLLSGFALAYGARSERWYRFLGRRVWRLLPAYWLALAGCWAFQVYRHAYAAYPGAVWKDLLYHASCLHLIRGDPYAFSISSAMWYMGLIVPLYVAFALVRPWVAKGNGYAALGWATAAAGVGGTLLLKFVTPAAWGPGPLGHVPHRLPAFFLGAVVGLAWARREPPDALARNPGLLLGLVVGAAGPLYFGYAQFAFYLAAGAAILGVGMAASAAAERWRLARPIALWLAGLGLISYELYLVHQYLMVTANEALLTPWLRQRWPALDRQTGGLLAAGLSLAAACWVAWGLRWVVSWRETRATWRIALPAVLATSALLAGSGIAIATATRPDKTRTIRLTVAPPAGGRAAAGTEPIVGFGTPGAGDLVLLQHDGAGLARVGIDHWGSATAFSDWVNAALLTNGPWEVVVGRRGITVRAGPVELRSPYRTFNWRARATVGRNEAGFSSTPPAAASRVEKAK